MNNQTNLNRTQSVLLSLFIYVIAVLTAVLTGRQFSAYHPLVMIAAGDLAGTVVVFIFSRVLNNSSAYDPYWSVKPLVILLVYLFLFNPHPVSFRQWIVIAGVFLYALRLTSNFYRDWPGFKHEDWRYVNFRIRFGENYWLISFLAIHLFPTIMVYLGCLALLPILSEPGHYLNVWDAAATPVLLGSILLAFVADEQLRFFRKHPANKGKTIGYGLWRYSRHPNYLGEILTWWGLFLFAMASRTEYWWTFIGPVTITLMFLFASIPMIEKRHSERRLDYPDYKAKTSMLVPFKSGRW